MNDAMPEARRASKENFQTAAKFRIISTFKNWDRDGNGQISMEELIEVLSILGVAREEAADIFKRVDMDKSGYIDYTEFVAWMFGSASDDLPEGTENKLWKKEVMKQVMKEATVGDAEKAMAIIRRDNIMDINEADSDGTTVLMAACKGGKVDLVKGLLGMGFTQLNVVDKEGNTALDYAVASANAHVIEALTSGRTSADNCAVPFLRALLPAVLRGDVDSVRQGVLPRVEFHIDIDRHMETYHGLTLMAGGYGGSALIVQRIDAGLVDEWNKRSPNQAVQVGDHLVRVNVIEGNTKELMAELQRYKEMTVVFHRFMPEAGLDPNQTDDNGATLLHHACKKRRREVLDAILLARQVLVNKIDRFGRTALDIAEELGEEEMVTTLMDHNGKHGAKVKTASVT